MDFDEKLFLAMINSGVHIDGEINWASREFQRFRVKNHWHRGKPLFIRLFGDGAAFGDWREPATWRTVWEKSYRDLTPQEKVTRQASIASYEHEKQLLRNHAIWRAQEMLNHRTWRGDTCVDASPDHPYIREKLIIPFCARQIRSYLILPVTDVDRKLISLQYIKANGFKQFKKHASPKGGMLFIGDIKPSDTIRICEGWATGCSIYEAVGSPVVVSFGASNLASVAAKVRMKYPANRMYICADNDQFLKENIGLKYGLEAAKISASKIVYPEFPIETHSHKPTDFNDLFVLLGVEETERQLLRI